MRAAPPRNEDQHRYCEQRYYQRAVSEKSCVDMTKPPHQLEITAAATPADGAFALARVLSDAAVVPAREAEGEHVTVEGLVAEALESVLLEHVEDAIVKVNRDGARVGDRAHE